MYYWCNKNGNLKYKNIYPLRSQWKLEFPQQNNCKKCLVYQRPKILILVGEEFVNYFV